MSLKPLCGLVGGLVPRESLRAELMRLVWDPGDHAWCREGVDRKSCLVRSEREVPVGPQGASRKRRGRLPGRLERGGQQLSRGLSGARYPTCFVGYWSLTAPRVAFGTL